MKPKVIFLLLAMLSFTIFSCHKNDKQGSSLKVKIIGTWNEQVVYTSLYKNGDLQQRDTVLNEDGDYTKIEFKSDQTVSSTSSSGGQVENTAGRYSLQGSKLTLIEQNPQSGEKDTSVVNCQINGSKMIWEQDASVSSSSSGEVDKYEVEIHFTKE